MFSSDQQDLLNLFNLDISQAFELVLQVLNSDYFMAAVVSFDNNITYLNKGMARLLGHPREHLVNQNIFKYFRDQKALSKILNDAYKTGIGQDDELYMVTSDDSSRLAGLLVFRVADELGNFKFFVAVGHDKGEPAQGEILAAKKEFLAAMLGSLCEMIFTLDDKMNFVFVNKAATELTGYDVEELIGSRLSLLLTEQDKLESVKQELDAALRDATVFQKRVNVKRKDGSRFIANLSASRAIRDVEDKVSLIGSLRDISAETEAEDELTRRNRHLATLSRITSLVAEGGNISFLLEKILLILMQTLDLLAAGIYTISSTETGYNELIAQRGVPRDLAESFRIIPDNQGCLKKIVAKDVPVRLLDLSDVDTVVVDHMQKHQFNDLHLIAIKNKGRVYGYLGFLPVHGSLDDEESALIGAIAVQVSVAIENSHLLRELRANQAKYSAVVERANDGIMISQDDVFKFINKKLADMLGYPVSDMIDMPIVKTMPPVDMPNIMDHYYQRISGDVPKEIYQGSLLTRDGRAIPVEFNAIAIEYEGKPASLSFVRDLSERIEMQNEILAQKETAEFYNDVLTHDVNNMMQTILGNISLLNDANGENLSEDQKKFLASADRMARRCGALIDQVRELMMIRRVEPAAFIPVSLKPTIQEAMEIVRDQFRDVTIQIELVAQDNQFVLGNQLTRQLFVNLISNAVRHNSQEDKQVAIAVVDDPEIRMWRITIEDNGDGIDPEARAKLYKRFARFSQKEGIGLGMSIVKAIVDVMAGEIEIDERVGGKPEEGTCITLFLPKA